MIECGLSDECEYYKDMHNCIGCAFSKEVKMPGDFEQEDILEDIWHMQHDLNCKIGRDTINHPQKERWGIELILAMEQEIAELKDCLVGDTKIMLLDGTDICIRDLVGNYKDKFVFSCNNMGEIVPGKIIDAWKVKDADEIVEITLDNDEVIKSTLDHRFMLRDSSYKEAQKLCIGESLMPLYYTICDSDLVPERVDLLYHGRPMIFDNNEYEWRPLHRVVAQHYVNNLYNKVVHHKDFNKLNNHPDNLQIMSEQEHKSLHMKEMWKDKDFRLKMEELFQRLWNDNDYRLKMDIAFNNPELIEKRSRMFKEMWENEEFRIIRKEYLNKFWSSNDNKERQSKVMSDNLKEMWKNDEYRVLKSNQSKDLWKGDKYRNKMSNTISKANKDNGMKIKQLIGRSKKLIDILVEDNLEVNESNYERIRLQLNKDNKAIGVPSWNTYQKIVNHKVKHIRIMKLEEPIGVYDISVDKYHNFALSSGIFAHNCYNWKWWSKRYDKQPKGSIIDWQNAKVEYIDILHFFISLGQTLGFTPEEIFRIYKQKWEVNIKRQEDGYDHINKSEEDNRSIK